MANAQTFTANLINTIRESGVTKVIAKGEFLVKEGDVEKHLYLIESGTVRAFLLSEFEELTIRFGYEGSIINSLSSFVTGKPSELYLEAIRKSSVKMLAREKFFEFVHHDLDSLKGYISLMELLVTQQLEREIDLLTVSPNERLKRVLDRSPNLFQQVPLKYIASYLRMTPETLSRVRNS